MIDTAKLTYHPTSHVKTATLSKTPAESSMVRVLLTVSVNGLVADSLIRHHLGGNTTASGKTAEWWHPDIGAGA